MHTLPSFNSWTSSCPWTTTKTENDLNRGSVTKPRTQMPRLFTYFDSSAGKKKQMTLGPLFLEHSFPWCSLKIDVQDIM
jgi:hypothetical protein